MVTVGVCPAAVIAAIAPVRIAKNKRFILSPLFLRTVSRSQTAESIPRDRRQSKVIALHEPNEHH
jgi:hypothetical protein